MTSQLPKPGERVEKAAQFVPKTEKLLDVGCGNGIITHFIKQKVKALYGVDNQKNQVKEARKLGMIASVVDLDSQELPYEQNFFDVVTCLDVIEHVKDPSFLLKNIYTVLKRNGVLIITTPNIRFSDHLFRLLFKGVFPKTSEDTTLYDGGHIHFFTYSDMHMLLTNAKFSSYQDEEIINKLKRGWKGQLLAHILGKRFMREFRTPGILILARK